ncbi:hypothetical protein DYB32_007166 [Aphanomyces invadans]|uniref:S-phase kinase-associated protein 1A n=1 Tax=Aphanomyces invadans TaxID=157072 RepID=A0A418APH8_9STRA|nr:hypothetical protein DYB32_007166 [Aphanomyces invadans]
MADTQKVNLVSQDGDSFEVSREVAVMSELVRTMIADEQDDEAQEIPLPNVKSTVLSKVIEFCSHHHNNPMPEIEKAANYMDIKSLLDLACAKVASMIKGKTPQEIRETFNITNDFTPEEEAQIREENKWCEEA